MPPRSVLVLLTLLLAAHFGWLLARFEPAYSSPDASGYFVQARVLLESGSTGFLPESPLQYVGVPWLETERGELCSRYPPGLPLLLAAVWSVFGFVGALLVIPIAATLLVLATFLWSRRWIGDGPALVAAALMAAVPIANRQALHADAHTVTALLVVLGLLALDRWNAEPSRARAFAAGLLLAAIPAVRYPDGLVAIGVASFLVTRLRCEQTRNTVPWVLAGALGPIAALLLHHQMAFGSPIKTGYALTHEQTAFAWEALAGHVRPYLASLTREALGPFAFLGAAGMIVRLFRPGSRATGLLWMGAVVPLAALYLSYYWGAPGDTTNRFFIPVMPILFVAALDLLVRLERRWRDDPGPRRIGRSLLAVAVVAQVVLGVVGSEDRMLRERMGTTRGAAVLDWLAATVEDGAVVIANRAVQGSVEPLGRYRLVDDRLVPGGPRRATVKTRNPNLRFLQDATNGESPSPHQHDKLDRLRARYEGKDDSTVARLVLEDLRAWANGTTIVWLATQDEIHRFAELAGPNARLEPMGPIELPTPQSALLDLVRDDESTFALPYWVIEPPLEAWRLR